MSNLWRTGLDPQKADKGLRGIGLFVILLAFLFASNRFVTGNKPTTPATTPAKPPAVLADSALATILPRIDKAPRFSFASFGALATTPTVTSASTSPAASTPAGSPAVAENDVVVTADASLMTRIVAAKQCAPPVTIGTDTSAKPALVYRACAVFHGKQVRPRAQVFIGELTSLQGRVILLDAGLDLPDRNG